MQLRPLMVTNKKFALLLKTILSNDIPQADVDFVKTLPADTLFIDTREENEYSVSSISGAMKTGFKNFDIEMLKAVNKDRPLVIYCSIGLRSEKICSILLKQGYSNVYNLYGGIFEWVNRGLTVVDKLETPVKLMHGFSPFWGVWVIGVQKIYY